MAGWDDLDNVAPPVSDEPVVIDKLFTDALNNVPGRKLLAYWKRTYLDQPVAQPGAHASTAYHREGQNSVVREALTRIARELTPRGAK